MNSDAMDYYRNQDNATLNAMYALNGHGLEGVETANNNGAVIRSEYNLIRSRLINTLDAIEAVMTERGVKPPTRDQWSIILAVYGFD